MGSIDDQRAKALEWLDDIKNEVQALVVHNYIFGETQKLIRANPKLVETPSHYYVFLAQVFANSMVLGVRRQVDAGPDSVSLRKLLLLLREHPTIASREYYLSLYETSQIKDQADTHFDQFADKAAASPSWRFFQEDIDELSAKTVKIRHYADRRIAHRDSRDLKYDEPHLNELTDAIKCLERTTVKYLALLKAEVLGTLLPTFQYDWQRIFTFPWIERNSHDPNS